MGHPQDARRARFIRSQHPPPHPGAGDAEKSIGNRLSVIEIKAFRSVHPELSLAKAMEELSKSKAELQQRSS